MVVAGKIWDCAGAMNTQNLTVKTTDFDVIFSGNAGSEAIVTATNNQDAVYIDGNGHDGIILLEDGAELIAGDLTIGSGKSAKNSFGEYGLVLVDGGDVGIYLYGDITVSGVKAKGAPFDAVVLDGDSLYLKIGETSDIYGRDDGIVVRGVSESLIIDTAGNVSAGGAGGTPGDAILVAEGGIAGNRVAGSVTITNSGEIYGADSVDSAPGTGINVFADGNVSVTNELGGSITAGLDAIYVSGEGTVFIGNDGAVEGGEDGIQVVASGGSTNDGVVVESAGSITAKDGDGITVDNLNKYGDVDVTSDGTIDASGNGIRTYARYGATTVSVSGAIDAYGTGILSSSDTGSIMIDTEEGGDISGNAEDGIRALVDGGFANLVGPVAEAGNIIITANGNIGDAANSVGNNGITARNYGNNNGYGDIEIYGAGDIYADKYGIVATNEGTGSVDVNFTGNITANIGDAIYVFSGGGAISVTTGADAVLKSVGGDGIHAVSDGGDITINSNAVIFADPGINVSTTGTGDHIINSNAAIYATTDGIYTRAEDGVTDIDVTALIDADTDTNYSGDGIDAAAKTGSISIYTSATGKITGYANFGIVAETTGGKISGTGIADYYGNIEIDVNGDIGDSGNATKYDGIRATNTGAGGSSGNIAVYGSADIYGGSWIGNGIHVINSSQYGDATVGNAAGSGGAFTGNVTGVFGDGIRVLQNDTDGNGNILVELGGTSKVTGFFNGVFTRSLGYGNVTVEAHNGVVQGYSVTGIHAQIDNADSNGDVHVDASANVYGYNFGVHATTNGLGDVYVNTSGSVDSSDGDGIRATSTNTNIGAGSVEVRAEGAVTSYLDGIHAFAKADGDVTVLANFANSEIDTSGPNGDGIDAYSHSGVVTVRSLDIYTADGRGIYAGTETGAVYVYSDQIDSYGTGIDARVNGNSGPITIGAEPNGGTNDVNTRGDYAIGVSAYVFKTGNIDIDVATVKTAGDGSGGIYAHTKSGDVYIEVDSVTTTGLAGGTGLSSAFGIFAEITKSGDIDIDTGAVKTAGEYAFGILANNEEGNIVITATTVETIGTVGLDSALPVPQTSFGIGAVIGTEGNITIDATSAKTQANYAFGVGAYTPDGDFEIDVDSVWTYGDGATGIAAITKSGEGKVYATTVSTDGIGSGGVYAYANGSLIVGIETTVTGGDDSTGITAIDPASNVKVSFGSVKTEGYSSGGIYAKSATSDVDIVGAYASGGDVTTYNDEAPGILVRSGDDVTVDVDVVRTGVNVGGSPGSKGGFNSDGIAVYAYGDIDVDATSVYTDGTVSAGVYVISSVGGTIDVDVGSIDTNYFSSVGVFAMSSGSVKIAVDDIDTAGSQSYGVQAMSFASTVLVDVGNVYTGGTMADGVLATGKTGATVYFDSVTTDGFDSEGIEASSASGDVLVKGGSVTTHYYASQGIVATSGGVGNVTVQVTSVNTFTDDTGSNSGNTGIVATANGTGFTSVTAGTVNTHGDSSDGVRATSSTGNSSVTITSSLSTDGADSDGVDVTTTIGNIYIDTDTATLITTGANAEGIVASSITGYIDIDVENVWTYGSGAEAILASSTSGTIAVSVEGLVYSDESEGLDLSTGGYGSIFVNMDSTSSVSSEASTGILASGNDGNLNLFTDVVYGYNFGIFATLSSASNDIDVFAYDNVTAINNAAIYASNTDVGGVYVAVEGGTTSSTFGEGVKVNSGNSAWVNARGNIGSTFNDGIEISAVGTADIFVEAGNWVRGEGAGADWVIDVDSDGTLTIDNDGTIESNAAGSASYNDLAIIQRGTGNVNIYNAGRLEGVVDFSAGGEVYMSNTSNTSWHTTGTSTFSSGGDNLYNTGLIATAAGGVTTTLDFGGSFDNFYGTGTLVLGEPAVAASQTNFINLEDWSNGGNVWFGAATTGVPTLTDGYADDHLYTSSSFYGYGSSIFHMDAELELNGVADTMTAGALSGSTQFRITDIGGTGAFNDPILLVDGTSSTSDAFNLYGGTIEKGLVSYVLDLDGADWSLVGVPGLGAAQISRLGAGLQELWHQTDHMDHVTNLRRAYQDGTVMPAQGEAIGSEGSLWARGVYSDGERDSRYTFSTGGGSMTYDLSTSQSVQGIQLGGDLVSRLAGGSALAYGIFGGYANAKQDFVANNSRSDVNAWQAGAYVTWLMGPGYIDAMVKADFLDGGMQISAPNGKVDIDGTNLGAQLNAGYKFDITEQLFIEPLATLSYVRTKIDSDQVAGGSVDFRDMDSLRGRLGARLGYEWMSGETTIRPFGQVAYWKEWEGDNRITLSQGGSSWSIQDKPVDGWWQFGVGLEMLNTNGFSAFLRGDYSATNLKDNPEYEVAAVRAGIRWTFGGASAPAPVAPTPPTPPAPPAPPAAAPVQPPPPVTTFIVFFDFDKSDLTAEAQEVVTQAVAEARRTGQVRIEVTGHTDTVGSAAYNQALSERRAESVEAEMVRQGMNGDEIVTTGRGFTEPLVQTGPGVREPQNRRAVIDLGGN